MTKKEKGIYLYISRFVSFHRSRKYMNYRTIVIGSVLYLLAKGVINGYFFLVAEGGRLEQELEYTRTTVGEGRGTTSQLVIQTPRADSNILTVPSLQFHLQTLLKVVDISVDMFDV